MSRYTTPVGPASLLHVEESPAWSDLIRQIACCWPEVSYEGCVETLAQARWHCRHNPPAVLLLDLWLPDGDALAFVRELRLASHRVKIMFYTARVDEVVMHHFDRMEVDALVWKKTSPPSTVRTALGTVLAGGRHFPAELESNRRGFRTNPHAWFKVLSDREQALLPLLGRGLSDVEVASSVGLSPNTVHSHRQSIMHKLGLHRSVELVAWAQRTGFVPPVSVQAMSSGQVHLKS